MEQLNALAPSSTFSQDFSSCPDLSWVTVSTRQVCLSTAVLSPSVLQPKEVSTASPCKAWDPKAHKPVICGKSGTLLIIWKQGFVWIWSLFGEKELHTTPSASPFNWDLVKMPLATELLEGRQCKEQNKQKNQTQNTPPFFSAQRAFWTITLPINKGYMKLEKSKSFWSFPCVAIASTFHSFSQWWGIQFLSNWTPWNIKIIPKASRLSVSSDNAENTARIRTKTRSLQNTSLFLLNFLKPPFRIRNFTFNFF